MGLLFSFQSYHIVSTKLFRKMLLEERELYLNGLESYCTRNGLDYRDYYIDSSKRVVDKRAM